MAEEKLSPRVQAALEKHSKGYNCSQAVGCAFCDKFGVDEALMFRMMEAFGCGMGNTEGTCGAISGAIALVGLKNSTANLDKPNSKAISYPVAREIMREFKEMNGSVLCCDLKGVHTKKILRDCHGCVEDAAKLAEKYVFGDEAEEK